MKKILITSCVCSFVVSLCIFFNPLNAADTTVNNSPGGEPSLINNSGSTTSVLNTLYGAGNYTRVGDSFDMIWSSVNGNVSVVAKFAGNTQTLGYFEGISGVTDGSTFQSLYTVSGNGYGVGGSTSGLTIPSLRWGFFSGGNYFSSLADDNVADIPAVQDHMVTFLITGNTGGFDNNIIGNYIIAFEDSLLPSSDRDFQDGVFEVSGAVPTPEPSTYLLLGSVIALGAFLRRKKEQTSKIAMP